MTAPAVQLVRTPAPDAPADTAPPAASYTPEGIRRMLADGLPEALAERRTYLAGDHWDERRGWIGPHPGGTASDETGIWDEIKRAFTSRNAVREIAERHRDGVIGQEPRWGLQPLRPLKAGEQPDEAEQRLIDEAGALLTDWWDTRGALAVLQSAALTLLFAERAGLRLRIPATTTDEATGQSVVSVTDVADAIGKIHVEHPAPETARIVEDPTTLQPAALFRAEIVPLPGQSGSPREILEVEYVDDDGRTVLRQIEGAKDLPAPAIDLGGRLRSYEMRRAPGVVSAGLLQQQRALNLALSMVPRNLITGGWLERIMTNAQPPGEYVSVVNAVTGEPERRFVPASFETGAGVTNFVTGVAVVDPEDGSTKLATPGVHFRDPAPVDPAKDGAALHYAQMLEEAGQRHLLMSGDGAASAVSRIQARADYARTLRGTETEIARAGRWLLETVLATAEALAGTPGQFTGKLRVWFAPLLDVGPITPEEQRENWAAAKEGHLSHETALARNGVPDPGAELAAIEAQPSAQLADLQRVAETLALLVEVPGGTFEGALRALALRGVDPALLAALRPRDTDGIGAEDNPGRTTVPPDDEDEAQRGSPTAEDGDAGAEGAPPVTAGAAERSAPGSVAA